MVAERGQTPVGPESFAVGKDGSILVADVVNQRVVVYSSNGTYLHAIELPGIALGDVTADAQGSVYVYDQVRQALHQYDAHGTPQSALSLSPADINTRATFTSPTTPSISPMPPPAMCWLPPCTMGGSRRPKRHWSELRTASTVKAGASTPCRWIKDRPCGFRCETLRRRPSLEA